MKFSTYGLGIFICEQECGIMWTDFWKGDRVVEGTGLENRRAVKRTEGSNPSPSARMIRKHLKWVFFICH